MILMIGLTPLALLSVIGNLVLALRHPNNDGPSSKITRKVVAGMAETLIESGYDIPEEVLREWKKELAL